MAGSPAITCPECQKKFKTKADVQGKKIKCPGCAHAFVVPDLSTAVQAKGKPDDKDAPIPVAGLTPPKPADDEENDDPYGLTHADMAPRCPNCANEMESEDAVVCLFCGYNTLTRQWGKTEKTVAISTGRHFLHLLPGIACALLFLFCVLDQIYYCVVYPFNVAGTFMEWSDHESLRTWSTIFALSSMWSLGAYAYHRLIVKPLPDEQKLD